MMSWQWWLALIPGVALFVFFPPWRIGTKTNPKVPEDIEKHQQALRKFLRNETRLGMYGDSGDLDAARDAMTFFAHEIRDQQCDDS